jgi:hypothetical protein
MAGKSKNPLYTNQWFKHERHNSCRDANMYVRIQEEMINIHGITIFYYPITEYDLDGISSFWGEDPQKEYKEKYTLKCLSDEENDQLTFNSFGMTREESERTITINKRQFENITGKKEPQYGDHFLYTQNGIVYEIENFTDNNNIVLGQELWWTIYAKPRMVEGEIYGRDDCDSIREEVIDPDPTWGDTKSPCINDDGNVDEDIMVDVPGPQPMKVDDKEQFDEEKIDTILRNSWGGWDG